MKYYEPRQHIDRMVRRSGEVTRLRLVLGPEVVAGASEEAKGTGQIPCHGREPPLRRGAYEYSYNRLVQVLDALRLAT